MVAMVSLSESRAWYAPNGQDEVATPPSSGRGQRYEEEDDFEVEIFSPRLGRAKTRPSATTPAPPVKAWTTTSAPATSAPPPRPLYDKPAPPRRVVDHSYDYPEFIAAPNPTPPIKQSYFGVDLGSLSDSEGSGSGQESPAPSPTTDSPTSAAPAPALPEEGLATPDKEGKKTGSPTSNAALVLQLIKMLRWPLVAVVLIAVLGTCLLSGCWVGLFGRQCFDTNTHRRAVVLPKPRADQDISGDGLSLQTRRAVSKGTVPKNLRVTFSTTPKSAEGGAQDQGSVEHVRVVEETDL